ncbi:MULTISPECIES: hypothetical protein [unclassified Microcoleus]
MNEYQLTPAKHHQVQVVVSLNRVHLENYKTHNAVLTKLLERCSPPQG